MNWKVEAIDAHRSITIVLFIHTRLEADFQSVLKTIEAFHSRHLMEYCHVNIHCVEYDREIVNEWYLINEQGLQRMQQLKVSGCLEKIGMQFIQGRQLGKTKGDWRPIVINVAQAATELLNKAVEPFSNMYLASTVLYATESTAPLVNCEGNVIQLQFNGDINLLIDYALCCIAQITAPGAVKDYTKSTFKKSIRLFDSLAFVELGDEM